MSVTSDLLCQIVYPTHELYRLVGSHLRQLRSRVPIGALAGMPTTAGPMRKMLMVRVKVHLAMRAGVTIGRKMGAWLRVSPQLHEIKPHPQTSVQRVPALDRKGYDWPAIITGM